MANISFTSYIIGNRNSSINTIPSVLLPDGRLPPEGLFIALYGARDTLVAMQDAHIKAKPTGLMVYRVDMKVEAGVNTISRVNEETAKEAIFICLSRLTTSLESTLINRIQPGAKERTLVSIINDDPNLLHKLFECTDIFGALNVIVWQSSYKNGEKLQMIAIKDLSKITIKSARGPFTADLKVVY